MPNDIATPEKAPRVANGSTPGSGLASMPRQDAEEALQRALGQRLRQARRARGLTLQDVEERSDGRWKAVVIGSYERGDRAVSAARLTELAGFLDVEVSELLADLGREQVVGPLGSIRFDLAALHDAAREDGSLDPLVRLVAHVRWQRGDTRSSSLAVRRDDLDAVAFVLGVDPGSLADRLAEHDVVAR